MIKTQLQNLFNDSFSIFLQETKDEILKGINERSLCAALGICMSGNLSRFGIEGYHVDTDYNKKQNGEVKTIIGNEMEVIKIYADLILHSRGRNLKQDNLIAIEMKKSYRSNNDKIKDRNRLIAMTKDTYDDVWSYDGITHPKHVCRYILGIYIEFDISERSYILEFYEKGLLKETINSIF